MAVSSSFVFVLEALYMGPTEMEQYFPVAQNISRSQLRSILKDSRS